MHYFTLNKWMHKTFSSWWKKYMSFKIEDDDIFFKYIVI